MTAKIDLAEAPAGHNYTVRIDREETKAEQGVRLFKDVVFFVVAIGFVLAIASLCVHTVLSAAASAEEKKWAMSILSGATGGIIGYLVKR